MLNTVEQKTLHGRSAKSRLPDNLNDLVRSESHANHDDSSHAIGSESDFALFRDHGGRAHNEEGMFAFFRDQVQRDSSNANDEEKKANSEQSLVNTRSNPSSQIWDGDGGNSSVKKAQAKTFHGMPPSSSSNTMTTTEDQRQRRKSTSFDFEGLSKEDLMNFVLAESSRFEKDQKDVGDLERHLMAQVARLSIGSVNGESFDGDFEDPKFSVLREVVKSYMKGGISNAGNTASKEQMSQARRRESSPKEAPNVYELGDEGRRRDMIKDDDKDLALMRIASLQPGDAAWIRRTTGELLCTFS
jgi:hypothetical protein